MVTMNRDPTAAPRMIKRAMISGLPSAGVNVVGHRHVPIPVARYFTRVIGRRGRRARASFALSTTAWWISGSSTARAGHDKHGRAEDREHFFREDFRRVYLDEIGSDLLPATGPGELFGRVLQGDSEVRRAASRDLKLVVDYSNGTSSAILSPILRHLGVRLVELNATTEETRLAASAEEHEYALNQCASISAALKATMGARIDVGGERVWLVTGRGRILPGMTAVAAVADLVLRSRPGATIAVPVSASKLLDRLAEKHGGKVVRTKINQRAMAELAAKDEKVFMIGDGSGGFIFPAFQPAFDAMFAVAQIMGLLTANKSTLAEVVAGLPPYFMTSTKVNCPWERKGRIMRILHEQYRDGQTKQIDGIRIDMGDEWVLVLPDPDRPLFHVIAESTSMDSARALQDKYAAIITGLQD